MELELDAITKRYAAREAVSSVTLAARDGEFVVLLGPSGCGKSTLLRVVAGLETPDAGRVRLGGADITEIEPRRRDLAMVFQSYALYPHMSVAANIGYPLKVRKLAAVEIEKQVKDVAGRLGLARLLGSLPRQLSGGERQRVALARAIIRRPKGFLMDEPLSNLDARLRVEMRAELKHLQHELKTVTLYVTHDQAEAMTLAHRIAVLNGGRLQQYDTPWQIYHRPANLFVAGFLGSPSMNLLAGRIESGELVCRGLRIALGPAQLDALGGRREITLGVRPEDVEFSATERQGWHAARVYVTEEMGHETLVRLDANGVHITAHAAADARLDFDAPAWFRLKADRVHLFDTDMAVRL